MEQMRAAVVAPDGRSIPSVSTRLSRADRWGARRVRWNVGRNSYRVEPGLYAVGSPGPDSPVLVSANYKLSFDTLRRSLGGIDAWVLVLDTHGINVWCAAGKGTFGTDELRRRIAAAGLETVVAHRTLILPQLGATGVSGPEMKKSGWRVKYGPVRAEDLPAYFAAGQRKDAAMREVRFGLSDRMSVAPVEFMQAWPVLLALAAGAALLALPFSAGYLGRFVGTFLPLFGGVIVGTFLFPALLPWLPFRAFALKGAVLGLAWGIGSWLATGASAAAGIGLTLVTTTIVSFIAMNFTGSSTYTCQSGAVLEVRRGLPPMAASLVAGIGLCVASRVLPL